MPNYTPNYNLKKPGALESYNVEDQNGNMDLIDVALNDKINKSLATAANQMMVSSGVGAWAVKTLAQIKTWLGLGSAAYTDSTAYATAAQGGKADNAETKADAAAHKADIASQAVGKGASMIGVQDAGNHFTGTNIEAVLSELFTFANDGKTGVANAITAKGVAASSSDTFAALATKIGQINTGKKWATGTVTTAGSFDITELAFAPAYAFFYAYERNASSDYITTVGVASTTADKWSGISALKKMVVGYQLTGPASGNIASGNPTFGANSVTELNIGMGHSSKIRWYAFE